MAPELALLADGLRRPSLVTGKEDVYSLGMVFRKELKLHTHPVYGKFFTEFTKKMLRCDPVQRSTMHEVAVVTKAVAQLIDKEKSTSVKKVPAGGYYSATHDTTELEIQRQVALGQELPPVSFPLGM